LLDFHVAYSRVRSPGGAKRNPGSANRFAPDFAVARRRRAWLHPGYKRSHRDLASRCPPPRHLIYSGNVREETAMKRWSLAPCLLALALSPAALSPADAQDYPNRPIRVIVTTSPGGISDVFLRALGESLHQRLGQPIVVENRAGGNMIIGARACAEAP